MATGSLTMPIMTALVLATTNANHLLPRLPASVCGPRGKIRPLMIGNLPWQVFEYVDNRDRPSHISLMFVCDTSWRRLRIFPANWRDMDDAMLTELAAHR
jgi:hypothetical protein